MPLPLLLALVLQSQSIDFDGLKITTLPPITTKEQGPAKQFSGKKDDPIDPIYYDVIVTDLKQVPQRPTEEQIFTLHERKVRANPATAAHLFQKQQGKLGKRNVQVLVGSVIAPNAQRRPMAGMMASFAFIEGDKLYEGYFINGGIKIDTSLSAVRSLAMGEDRLTGISADPKGEFTLTGIPFRITASAVPRPSVVGTTNQFDAEYTASWRPVIEGDNWFLIRKVKADDKRTNSQLFHELASPYGVDGKTAEDYKVSGDSATVELSGQRYSLSSVSRVRFERSGPWIAILVSTARTTHKSLLKDSDISLVK